MLKRKNSNIKMVQIMMETMSPLNSLPKLYKHFRLRKMEQNLSKT